MKYSIAVSLAGAMLWLTGCASVSKVVVVEPVGPEPTGGAQGAGDGSLVIYSARTSADVDVNMAEWRWNNDFGKNEFLYEPAHSDYTIYAQNGEVFKHVRNARSMKLDCFEPSPPMLAKISTAASHCALGATRFPICKGFQRSGRTARSCSL